jgi:hypothetical protein
MIARACNPQDSDFQPYQVLNFDKLTVICVKIPKFTDIFGPFLVENSYFPAFWVFKYFIRPA